VTESEGPARRHIIRQSPVPIVATKTPDPSHGLDVPPTLLARADEVID
jgi:hypothetical protein